MQPRGSEQGRQLSSDRLLCRLQRLAWAARPAAPAYNRALFLEDETSGQTIGRARQTAGSAAKRTTCEMNEPPAEDEADGAKHQSFR